MKTRTVEAVKVQVDGTISVVTLNEGRSTLAGLQTEVDCRHVDVVGLTGQVDMWVDDEGLFMAPPNPYATALAIELNSKVAQWFHGTALFASCNKAGDTVSLPPAIAEWIRSKAGADGKIPASGLPEAFQRWLEASRPLVDADN